MPENRDARAHAFLQRVSWRLPSSDSAREDGHVAESGLTSVPNHLHQGVAARAAAKEDDVLRTRKPRESQP